MPKVAFDHEFRVAELAGLFPGIPFTGRIASEPQLELIGRPVAQRAQHSCHGHTVAQIEQIRVPASSPPRITTDCLTLKRSQRDRKGCRMSSTRNVDMTARTIGMATEQRQRTHPSPHRGIDQTGSCSPPNTCRTIAAASTMSSMLRSGKSSRYSRLVSGLIEAGPVDPKHPPSAFTQIERIHANDVPPVRINRLARVNHFLSPTGGVVVPMRGRMGAGGKPAQDENRVVTRRRQPSPSLIGHPRLL